LETSAKLNRQFGFLVGLLLATLGVYFWFGKNSLFYLPGLASFVAFVLAMKRPSFFATPTKYWMRFGLLISKITNPVIIGVVYFFLICPTALILKVSGKDQLSLRKKTDTKTYWKALDDENDTQFEQY